MSGKGRLNVDQLVPGLVIAVQVAGEERWKERLLLWPVGRRGAASSWIVENGCFDAVGRRNMFHIKTNCFGQDCHVELAERCTHVKSRYLET